MTYLDHSDTIFKILMVEDNPDDVELTREALKESTLNIDLNVVSDGIKALNYLRKAEEFKNATTPELILLDLNLPRMDGREVLAELKKDKNLRRIPVVVLTTSQNAKDIQEAYDLHANCYVTKPIDLNQFLKVVQTIEDFWLNIVKLPKT